MANEIRTGDPCGFNKGRSSKFRVGSHVWQTPEEGRRIYWPKRCGNNNKDEDNSPTTFNDKNHQASSQKFRQLKKKYKQQNEGERKKQTNADSEMQNIKKWSWHSYQRCWLIWSSFLLLCVLFLIARPHILSSECLSLCSWVSLLTRNLTLDWLCLLSSLLVSQVFASLALCVVFVPKYTKEGLLDTPVSLQKWQK